MDMLKVPMTFADISDAYAYLDDGGGVIQFLETTQLWEARPGVTGEINVLHSSGGVPHIVADSGKREEFVCGDPLPPESATTALPPIFRAPVSPYPGVEIKPLPHIVADSGKRQDFPTGSVRDSREGKGRYDLITPIGLRRLALVYERGAAKYGDRNWEKGQPVSRYLDSALRHIFTYLAGERSEDHLAQAAWNCLAAIHTQEKAAAGELPKEMDDVSVS